MVRKIALLVPVIALIWVFAQLTLMNQNQDVVAEATITPDEAEAANGIQLVKEFDHIEGYIANFSWTEDHRLVAFTGRKSMELQLVDGLTGEHIKVLLPPVESYLDEEGIQSFDLSLDGHYLAATYNQATGSVVSIWNLTDEAAKPILLENPGDVPVMEWSPDSQTLATVWGTEDERQLLFWDGATGELLHSQAIDDLGWVKWSSDGASYLTYQWAIDPPVLWDAATHEQMMLLPTIPEIQSFLPAFIAWSADGEVMIGIQCTDQSMHCALWRWHLPTNEVTELAPVDDFRSLFLSRIALSPDGKLLAVGDNFQSFIYLFDAVSGELVGEITTRADYSDPIRALSWSSDGETLAITDGGIQIWRVNIKAQ